MDLGEGLERMMKKKSIIVPLRRDSQTNESVPDYPCRCADCYVFCLFTGEKNRHEDVLDTSLWKFYVLPTATIVERFGEQKSVALSRIEEICEVVFWRELKGEINSAITIVDTITKNSSHTLT